MATLTIENIPDELYEQFKKFAELNRRSLNSEAILAIERVVHGRRYSPEALLIEARELREKTADYAISHEEFIQAKNEGRP